MATNLKAQPSKGVATRSTSAAALEDKSSDLGEIEALRKQLKLKEAQLAEQSQMLNLQRIECDQRETELGRIEQSLRDRELEMTRKGDPGESSREDSSLQFVQDLAHELANLRRDVEHLKPGNISAPRPDDMPIYANDDFRTPRISFRDAIDVVPTFDGNNMLLSQFIRACQRAREIVPPSAERNLTRLLVNKLRGRAYYAVADEPCDTVTQLTDLLTLSLGVSKTADELRGELSSIFLRPRETILEYLMRVKDLKAAILDKERREMGILDPFTLERIDRLTARSFCNGLPFEYNSRFKPEHFTNPLLAFAYAKELSARYELENSRYDTSRGPGRLHSRANVHHVGNPLAHSTPHRPSSQPVSRRNLDSNHASAHRPPTAFQRNGANNWRNEPSNRANDWRRESSNHTNNWGRESSNPPRSQPFFREGSPQVRGRGHLRDAPAKWCRYCKHPGHEIEECRKREFNNSRSGNYNRPPGNTSDGPRAGASRPESRPINAIATEERTDQQRDASTQ